MLAIPLPIPLRRFAAAVLASWLFLLAAWFAFGDTSARYDRLMAAIESGDVSAVNATLARAADVHDLVNSTPDEGISPLAAAAAGGRLGMVRLLLDRGADVNVCCWETPLAAAAEKGHSDVVNLLIARGAQVNDAEHGSEALWRAAIAGEAACVRVLLAHGAAPGTLHFNGPKTVTILRAAEVWHRSDVAAMLRQAGAK